MARAADVLAAARGELGVKESPAGSNRVKYNTWYWGHEVAGKDFPWCMAFVQWCFHQAGAQALLPEKTASCGALMRAARGAGLWVTGDYRPGDVVIYDFPGGGLTDHCGIVENAFGDQVTAIEGNTGSGNDANGGQVQRRARHTGLIVGACRPRYEKESGPVDNIPAEAHREAVEWAVEAGILRGNRQGDWMLSSALTRQQFLTMLYRSHPLRVGH